MSAPAKALPAIQSFQLTNAHGDVVTVLSQGAVLAQWSTLLATEPDGQPRDILLSYPSPADVAADPYYLGALVGPYANRVGGGAFMLDGVKVQLEQNEGRHHLHGGSLGLHRLQWQVLEQNPHKLVLVTEVPDGQGGYPGPVLLRISYQLSAPSATQSLLAVRIDASSSKATLLGPTLHPYFNLAGWPADAAVRQSGIEKQSAIQKHSSLEQHNSINQHQLRLDAAHYAVVDADNIPTGELRKVQGTVFDFNQLRPLADQMLDHNFVVHGNLQQPAAELLSPDGALKLAVCSDYPGLQLYTGDHLGSPFAPRQGVCLEPQFFPDSPNQKSFPFHFTRPGQAFVARIHYWLSRP